MLKNYNDYKFDLLIESLILESKIEFSPQFIELIKQIKKSRISKAILSIKKDNLDKDFQQNYIDTSSVKDEVTFTADRKAKEFFGGEIPNTYKVTQRDRYLTHSVRNKSIYDNLGYEIPDREPWNPPVGTIVTIKAEVKSSRSEVIYCWVTDNDGNQTVVNKSAIVPFDERINKIWSKYRNNIKIGRLVRSILTTSNIEFTTKEIEDFVNDYKSAYDIMSNAFLKFELVQGSKISYWYDGENYESTDSTLGSSCMADCSEEFFEIYSSNKNCSLLILYSDKDGSLSDGKYKSNKIKGRALVWNTREGDTFMDRIYTNNDSDVQLFRKYAYDKKWWCKIHQNSSQTFNVTNGNSTKEADYVVELEHSSFDYYPYVDSLSYINFDDKVISNIGSKIDADAEMNDTDGGHSDI